MLSLAPLLGLFLLVSELFLAWRRRAQSDSEKKDQGTLKKLWRIILVALFAGSAAALYDLGPRLPNPGFIQGIGLAFFMGGTALRWWSILYLGRFFTVDVAVAADHQLIETGPYRLVRHPSYSGLLLQFAGIALCLGYFLSLFLILIPIFCALRHRIEIEEAALTEKLGEPYRRYCARTRRLLPFLY